jgi:hypothetical protein
VVLIEHIATKLRPEVPAVETRRQFTDQQRPLRRQPDLPAIAGIVGLNAQILHDEIAITLEPRSVRNRRPRCHLDRLVDNQLLALATLGRAGALARLATGPLILATAAVFLFAPVAITLRPSLGFHSARLELRLGLLPLEHGDFVAHLLNDLCLSAVFLEQVLDLAQQLLHQRAALRVGNGRQLLEVRHG